MTDYTINFTDPLRSTFIIRPYTSNGNRFPTSSTRNATSTQASSVLLLYGKGHPEYGERTDENLLHLAENFSGASAPVLDVSGNTTVGVIWHREYLYWRDTSGAPADWYEYRNGAWTSTTVTENTLGSRPATAADGTLYYATDTATLYRYSDDERGLQQWVVREFEEDSVAPSGDPTRELVVNHDGTPSGWNVIASSTGGSFDSEYLRLDTTNGPLVGNLTIQKESPILTLDADGSPAGNPLIDLVGDSATIRLRGATNWSIADRPDGGANGTLEIRVGNTPGSNVYFEVDQDTGLLYARGDTAAAYATAMTVGSPDDDQIIPNKRYVDDVAAGVSTDSYVQSTGSSFANGVLTLGTNASHPDSPSFDVTGFTADQIPFVDLGSPDFTISEQGVAHVEAALTALDNTKLTLTALSGFVIQTVETPVEFTESVEVPQIVDGDPADYAVNKGYVDKEPYNRAVFIADGSPAVLRGPGGVEGTIPGSPVEVVVTLPWEYVVETNRLSIYQNGQKLIKSVNGYQDWPFAPSIGGSTTLTGLPSYAVTGYGGSPGGGFILDSTLGDVSSAFSVGDTIRVDGLLGSPSSIEASVVGATYDGTNTTVLVGGSPFTPSSLADIDPGNTVLGIDYTFILNLDGAGNVEVGTGSAKINGNDIGTGSQLLTRINFALVDTFGSNAVDAFFINGGIRFRSLTAIPPSTISVTNGPTTTSDLFDTSNLGADGANASPNAAEDGIGEFAYEEVEAIGGSPFAYAGAIAGTSTAFVRITTPINPGDVFEFISTPE